MSVVGIGVDVVEIDRVRTALDRTPSLLGRLFTNDERLVCTAPDGALLVNRLALRFAGKEAVAKAFGTGVRGFGFRDVEILPDELGKPVVRLHGGAADVARRLGVTAVHLGLTDSAQLAIANAVAEAAT